jgi:cbb3-type cytochrome oxidase maturation protein
MEVLIYLVPLALGLGLVGLVAFIWALNTGQFDDLDGAPWRAIMDDDMPSREPAVPESEERAPAQEKSERVATRHEGQGRAS